MNSRFHSENRERFAPLEQSTKCKFMQQSKAHWIKSKNTTIIHIKEFLEFAGIFIFILIWFLFSPRSTMSRVFLYPHLKMISNYLLSLAKTNTVPLQSYPDRHLSNFAESCCCLRRKIVFDRYSLFVNTSWINYPQGWDSACLLKGHIIIMVSLCIKHFIFANITIS